MKSLSHSLIGFLFHLAVLFLIVFPGSSHAQMWGAYSPELGGGNAATISAAGNTTAIDSGIVAGVSNPAGYFTSRNEILFEGDLWGSLSIQSHVKSPQPRPDFGSIFYLAKIKSCVFALSYRPLRHYQASAVYADGDLVSRAKFSEVEAALALRNRRGYSFGMALTWMNGTLSSLDINNVYRLEEVHRTVQYLALGLRKQVNNVKIGLVVEPPSLGVLNVGEPAISNIRDYTEYSFSGLWGLRMGIGVEDTSYAGELDVSFHNANSVDVDNFNSNTKGLLMAAGMSAKYQWQQDLLLQMGFRYGYAETESGRHLLYGIGARYEVTPEVALLAGIGIVQGVDRNYAALDDVLPYDLRIGILYHETP